MPTHKIFARILIYQPRSKTWFLWHECHSISECLDLVVGMSGKIQVICNLKHETRVWIFEDGKRVKYYSKRKV